MIDWTKPIQTKSGRQAELIYRLTNANPDYYQPMVVLIEDDKGIQSVETFTINGEFFPDGLGCQLDLINV